MLCIVVGDGAVQAHVHGAAQTQVRQGQQREHVREQAVDAQVMHAYELYEYAPAHECEQQEDRLVQEGGGYVFAGAFSAAFGIQRHFGQAFARISAARTRNMSSSPVRASQPRALSLEVSRFILSTGA